MITILQKNSKISYLKIKLEKRQFIKICVTWVGIVLLNLLVFGCCYSQNKYPSMVSIDGDSIIAFTVPQTKELTYRNERLKNCLMESSIKDSISTIKDSKINSLQSALFISSKQMELKDIQIDVLSNQKAYVSKSLLDKTNELVIVEKRYQKTINRYKVGVGAVMLALVFVTIQLVSN